MKTVDIGRRLVPALLVRDMNETLAFYQALGFTLTGCHPSQAAPTWAAPPQPVCSGTFYIFPDSVPKLAEELRGKVSFAWGPEVMDYGNRTGLTVVRTSAAARAPGTRARRRALSLSDDSPAAESDTSCTD